jgi:NodT family efflux transporter outer membrane factor (OMF) lipoprotein
MVSMPKTTKWRYGLIAMLLLTLCGCTVGPTYHAPDVSRDMAGGWNAASLANGERLKGRKAPMTAWWRQFKDPTLSGLVERLVDSSPALAEARQRIVEARAIRGVANAARLPQVDITGNYTHAKAGSKSVSFEGPPPGQEANLFAAGVTAGWEVDLWGRVAHLVEAANADIDASYESYRGMMVSLAAELTLAYIDVRTLQARLAAVDRNIALEEKTLDLARTQFHAGTGTQLSVTQTEILLNRTRALRPELERGITEAQNRIKVLLGEPPQKKNLGPGPMPAVPALIGIGIPADLLVRRPDIRGAERRYAAAVARIGAAEAQKYPRLSISGTFNLQSDTAHGLLDSEALIYSLGPGLRFPLFAGGRIRSNIAVRKSQAEQARLQLQQKILSALSEVENAGTGVVRTQERVNALETSVKAADRSVELARNLYRAGLVDFYRVLDAEEKQVATEEDLLVAKQSALAQVVRLYRNLGGGWQVMESNQQRAERKAQ